MGRWIIALAGFASVYLFWLIPSYIFQANYWNSWTYIFGDHLVLPLFNAIAFNIFVGLRRGTALKTLYIGLILLVLSVLPLSLFEPGAVQLREGLTLRAIDTYHSVFIFLELSFILTACSSYLWIERNRFNRRALFILFPLVAIFLGLVFWADAHYNFSIWVQVVTVVILSAVFITAFFRQKASNC